jgi:hypothetical protein
VVVVAVAVTPSRSRPLVSGRFGRRCRWSDGRRRSRRREDRRRRGRPRRRPRDALRRRPHRMQRPRRRPAAARRRGLLTRDASRLRRQRCQMGRGPVGLRRSGVLGGDDPGSCPTRGAVMPAERFRASDRGRRRQRDRLVYGAAGDVDDACGRGLERGSPQVARRDGAAKQQDELEPVRVPAHAGSIAAKPDGCSCSVDDEAVLAGALGGIEGVVRSAQELVGRLTGARLGDAEAGREPHLGGVRNGDRCGGERPTHP